MSTRICLLALIGLPAAGKTTFSEWLFALPQKPFNVIHLCYDNYLEAQGKEESEGAEFEFKDKRKKIFSKIQQIIYALKKNAKLPTNFDKLIKSSINNYNNNDFLIICDDNNYYRSMRYKLYQICRQNECAYAQIYFNTNLQTALKRNSARPNQQRVPEETMLRMAERLEVPAAGKQHWDTNTFTLSQCESDNLNTLKETILAFLVRTFENKLQPIVVKEATETVQSIVHKLDLLLRKRIGEILQAKDYNGDKTAEREKMAKFLCAKRKTLLHECKVKVEKESMSADELNEIVNLL